MSNNFSLYVHFEEKITVDIYKRIMKQMLLSNCSYNRRRPGTYYYYNPNTIDITEPELDTEDNNEKVFNIIDNYFNNGLSIEIITDHGQNGWGYIDIRTNIRNKKQPQNIIEIVFANAVHGEEYNEWNKSHFYAMKTFLKNVHKEVIIRSGYGFYYSSEEPYMGIRNGAEPAFLTLPGILKREIIPDPIFKIIEEHDVLIEDIGDGTLFFVRDYDNMITHYKGKDYVDYPDYSGNAKYIELGDMKLIDLDTARNELGLNPRPFFIVHTLNEEWKEIQKREKKK